MRIKFKKLRKKGSKKKRAKNVKVASKGRMQSIRFPSKLLAPVGVFLKAQLKKLEKRKKEISKEDPFENESRISDNASPDADAAEQFGHARTSAIKERLDKKIIQTKKALTRVKIGKYGICEDCGEMIDTDRLMVYPEATMCASCKAKRES
jgi:DnaK suppressor protein